MDEQKKSKLYTGRGDKGKTSLVGGKRVSKASPRLNAYGQLDELNSFIGLKQFILPAGGRAASVAHICRTVARRSERDIYAFLEAEPTAEIDPAVLQYINRLSDYFFVLGRAAARAEGGQEVVWKGSKEVF